MNAAALTGLLGAHLQAIERAAWDHEPDWDAVYDGAAHNWCQDASAEIVGLLSAAGIPAVMTVGGLDGNHHVWVALEDGTFIDATIGQYIDRLPGARLNPADVPWMTLSHGDEPALRWPDDRPGEADVRVAVIPAGHPFHGRYQHD